MGCEDARAVVSAALDGELAGERRAELDRHLQACPACRAWQERAQLLTRVARLGSADAVPGPDRAWKRSLVDSAPRRRVSERSLRIGVVAIAVVQAAVTLPFLVSGSADAIRDQGALDVALAVGLLVVAWRPWLAAGLQTFLGVAALLLIGTELIEMLGGDGELVDLGRHLLVLASWVLVRSLGRLAPSAPSTSRAAPLRGPGRRAWPGHPRSAPVAARWPAARSARTFHQRRDRKAA